MSVDPNRWINTIPFISAKFNKEKYKLDPSKWINTLPKKENNIFILSNTINSNPKSNSGKKYSLTIIGFVIGLILVSVFKNETKNLEKEISNLLASINTLKIDLHQATLDHEVITSPENISRLAKKYLESDLASYKKSQIKLLNKKEEISIKPEKTEFDKSLQKTAKDKKSKIQLIFAKKIKAKKTELVKLQELYSKPEEIPKELRVQVVRKIKTKRKELNELKRIYSEPESIFKSKKIQKWAGFQVVKVFLGMPIIPGK